MAADAHRTALFAGVEAGSENFSIRRILKAERGGYNVAKALAALLDAPDLDPVRKFVAAWVAAVVLRSRPPFEGRLDLERRREDLMLARLALSRIAHAASQVTGLESLLAAELRAGYPDC